MAQQELSETLASNASSAPPEKTIFLDTAWAMQKAVAASEEAGCFQFEFEPSSGASLVQIGNSTDFEKPQPVAALDLAGATLLRVELLHAKAKVSNGFALLVALLSDASGQVIARQRLPLWPAPAQVDCPVPPGTMAATFAVRIAGTGSFEELKLHATVFRDQGAEVASRSTCAVVLRIPPSERPDSWLNLVPAKLRPKITSDFIAAQQLGIAKLRRQLVSSGGHREVRPSFDEALERMLASFRKEGLTAAIGQAICDAPELTTQSRLLEEFATHIEGVDRRAALEAYWFAYAARPGALKARKIALKMFKSGNISSAASLSKNGPQDNSSVLGPELQLCAKLFERLPAIPARAAAQMPLDGGLAYVAASAVPYMTTGYTVRTHELLAALRRARLNVRCAVRPGFPWDRNVAGLTEGSVPDRQTVGDVEYCYSRLEHGENYSEVIERTAADLEHRFRQWRPAIVQAASNHRNAFPALIAARRVGAVFVYEIRGLWELSAATTNPGWEKTERFALERRLELTIASAADRVLTITRGVANELISAGVDPRKIEQLPNAVDTDLFRPLPKDGELAERFELAAFDLCIVYAGALVLYEGLDDLIRAIAVLRDKGLRVRLILVGHGAFRPNLQELTASLDLDDRVTFVGQVPPASVPRYWSLADAVVLPRKPFKVCKVVSPLKPFEAMAMSKVVVLSDLPVMREIVQDDETGLLCRSEDPVHIAEVLERLMASPELRARLGRNARQWIVEKRTWAANAHRLREIYHRVNGPGAAVDRGFAVGTT